MTFDDVVYLIKEAEETKDDYGNPIYSEPERKMIFCNESSVSRSEFYSAGTVDLKPQAVITIHDFEYENEKKVEYKNKVYEVIRTYRNEKGLLELTVGDKIGS